MPQDDTMFDIKSVICFPDFLPVTFFLLKLRLTFILIFCIVLGMKTITKTEIQNRLEKHKEFIKSKFHVTEIGLFGSFVSGEHTSSSDIDILVDFKKGHKDFFNYMRLKYYLEEVLEREVDLVMKGAVKTHLKENIFGQVQYV